MRREGPRVFFSLLNAVAGFDIFFFWFSNFVVFFFRGQLYFFVTFRRRGNVTVREALCMRTNILDEKFCLG